MRTAGLFSLSLLYLAACGGEFIPDPIDPRLPRYSEEGKDVAGCFINDELWQAVRTGANFPPNPGEYLRVQFHPEDSTIRFRIDGRRKANTASVGTYVELYFVIDNRLTQFESLGKLHQTTIPLDGQHSYAGLEDFSSEDHCPSGAGQLIIRKAEFIPGSAGAFILAGTFSFTVASDSCERLDVRNGRFDYRVTTASE